MAVSWMVWTSSVGSSGPVSTRWAVRGLAWNAWYTTPTSGATSSSPTAPAVATSHHGARWARCRDRRKRCGAGGTVGIMSCLQQADLLEQLERLLPVAELGDGHGRGAEVGERPQAPWC